MYCKNVQIFAKHTLSILNHHPLNFSVKTSNSEFKENLENFLTKSTFLLLLFFKFAFLQFYEIMFYLHIYIQGFFSDDRCNETSTWFVAPSETGCRNKLRIISKLNEHQPAVIYIEIITSFGIISLFIHFSLNISHFTLIFLPI